MLTAPTGTLPPPPATAARKGPPTEGTRNLAAESSAALVVSSEMPKETEAEATTVVAEPAQLPWPVSEESAGTGAPKTTVAVGAPPTTTCTREVGPEGSAAGSVTRSTIAESL